MGESDLLLADHILQQPRSATVRARGRATVLTLDERAFLKRVHEDPSLAFRMMMKKMSLWIRDLHVRLDELSRRQGEGTVPPG